MGLCPVCLKLNLKMCIVCRFVHWIAQTVRMTERIYEPSKREINYITFACVWLIINILLFFFLNCLVWC